MNYKWKCFFSKKDDEGQHQTKISLESNYLKFYLSGVSDYETKAEFIVKYEYDDEEKSHNEDLKIMVMWNWYNT